MTRALEGGTCALCTKSIRWGARIVFHPPSAALPATLTIHRRCYERLKADYRSGK